MMRRLLTLTMLLTAVMTASAQTETKQPVKENQPIQLSGMVVTEENGNVVTVPYTNIYIVGEKRGTYCNDKGFFSIVVNKGDVLQFSAIGYEKASYTVPDSLKDDRYSLVQILTSDTILLAEAVIFPWPDRDHFRLEFLEMDVTNDLDERAKENLSPEAMAKVEQATAADGKETASFYMRQQARSYYATGQLQPMNILSPTAWQQFFQAWKNGDFKKKSGN